jgi:hypothetical protein
MKIALAALMSQTMPLAFQRDTHKPVWQQQPQHYRPQSMSYEYPDTSGKLNNDLAIEFYCWQNQLVFESSW